jgi:tRNA (guanine-N(7)-)-methyltransferase subunit TRM82
MELMLTFFSAMSKRPCSVVVTGDDATIICADKFGDVYSLPLIPGPTSEGAVKLASKPSPAPEKVFTPSANDKTVHSMRNLKALENQLRATSKPSDKVEPTFEHTLLLGHVSMLTDVTLSEINGRKYILTGDRDEHIRVSRGIPQAHVIEGFCFGHKDFISRLTISPSQPEILFSGSGDGSVIAWDWLSGTVLHQVFLHNHVESVRSSLSPSEGSESIDVSKIVISQIRYFSTANAQLAISCEG